MLGLMGKKNNYINPATCFTTYLHAAISIYKHYRQGFHCWLCCIHWQLSIMCHECYQKLIWTLTDSLWIMNSLFFTDLQHCIPLLPCKISQSNPTQRRPTSRGRSSRAKKLSNTSPENTCFWFLTNICHIVVY